MKPIESNPTPQSQQQQQREEAQSHPKSQPQPQNPPQPQSQPQPTNQPSPSPSPSPSPPSSPSSSHSSSPPPPLTHRPIPTDPDELVELVRSLQHALATKELTLREKEKELQLEKQQRVQSATGVLNQAMKIIRPTATATTTNATSGTTPITNGTSVRRDSFSTLGGGSMGISPALIQLHEKQKLAHAAAAAAAAATSAAQVAPSIDGTASASALTSGSVSSTTSSPVAGSIQAPKNGAQIIITSSNDQPSDQSTTTQSSSLPPILPTTMVAAVASIPPSPSLASSVLPPPVSTLTAHGLEFEDSTTLKRELMDVLLAFAENELIVPNAERTYHHGAGGSMPAFTIHNESFSAIINSSSLDPITKQWLTAEFTMDRHQLGAHGNGTLTGTSGKQRSVSVIQTGSGNFTSIVNAHNASENALNGASTGTGNGSHSLYANARLLVNPDLISIHDLETWDFDATSFTTELLVVQAYKMFESFDLFKRFHIQPNMITNFIVELERNYIATNPYHNFMSALRQKYKARD